MGTWVVSLLGIVVITLVCDVILPQGQTSKYVKTVAAVIVVCSIVFPLANMLSCFDWKLSFEENDVYYQQGYLDFVSFQKKNSLADACQKVLNDNGYQNCVAVVELDENLDATSVTIYLDDENLEQSQINAVVKLVLSVVNVDKENVCCVGR